VLKAPSSIHALAFHDDLHLSVLIDQRTTGYALAHGGSYGRATTVSAKVLTITLYPRTTYPNPTLSDEARTIQGLTVSYFRAEVSKLRH
jgi:hypothetical protein